MYELHIYTMGDKAYAREIAGLIDPQGKLFAGRVVSAADRCDRCTLHAAAFLALFRAPAACCKHVPLLRLGALCKGTSR